MIGQQVLDHGFVKLRNVAGPTRRSQQLFDADDTDPANSARMSFDSMDQNRTREMDLRLCDYLMKNWHSTPFEMVECWLEMKMPIFVARQFVRHRTVSINEVSARYVTLPAQWYIPAAENVGTKPKTIKQGRVVDDTPIPDYVHRFRRKLDESCRRDYEEYCGAVTDGVPAELARCFLHVNHYTHWLWKQDLHNLMHFLRLRLHSHAQWEARQYAEAVEHQLRMVLPHSMALFDKYRRVEE